MREINKERYNNYAAIISEYINMKETNARITFHIFENNWGRKRFTSSVRELSIARERRLTQR